LIFVGLKRDTGQKPYSVLFWGLKDYTEEFIAFRTAIISRRHFIAGSRALFFRVGRRQRLFPAVGFCISLVGA